MSSNQGRQAKCRTRIIATLGPASRDRDTIARLIEAGVDTFRLNFSHATHAEHGETLRRIRAVAEELEHHIDVIQDLQGPKVRVSHIGDGLHLEAGQQVVLYTAGKEEARGRKEAQAGALVEAVRKEKASGKTGATVATTDPGLSTWEIPIDHPAILPKVQVDQKIFLDEGRLLLRALSQTIADIEAGRIPCRVEIGGPLQSRKAVHIPGVEVDVPILDASDETDLAFGLQQGFDMVAVSYVRTAADMDIVRRKIVEWTAEHQAGGGSTGLPPETTADGSTTNDSKKSEPHGGPQLIAKIETSSAVANLEAICKVADAIWVARGDLGMEMPLEQVPVLQKQIVSGSHAAGKPVAIATQLLESMIENRRPTRAEATDVANAIFDGADALLLSGETAVGEYPVLAVQWLARLALEAEAHPEYLVSNR